MTTLLSIIHLPPPASSLQPILTHPWALLGLVVLVLPLLVSRFTRQKPEPRVWGSTMILQRALKKVQTTNRVRDRLLLLLRMLLLTFLILGLAEPVLRFTKLERGRLARINVGKTRILIVDGSPENARNLAFFLKTAVESANDDSRFEVEIVPETSWPNGSGNSNEILILCELATLNAKQTEFLEAFLKSGSGIMVFCGKRTDAENWNRFFFEPLHLDAFAEAVRNSELQTELGGEPWNPLEYRHEILEKFKDRPNSGLLVRAGGFFVPLNFAAGNNAESPWSSVISFSNGYPVLAAYSDQTRCLLVCSTSLLENGMVAHPTFVPLVMESVSWLQKQSETPETIHWPLSRLCFFVALLFFLCEIWYSRFEIK